MKKSIHLLALTGFALAFGNTPLSGAAPAKLSPAELDFFEKKIRPVLVETCYECHSTERAKNRGGLVVDSRDGLLKGGDSGAALVPGNPDQSLLIRAIRYTDEDLQMPPKGKKLSSAQIADLEAWVRMGAPDPRTAQVATRSMRDLARGHWAFQPVRRPFVPEVKNKQWIKSPIDSFILAKLEKNDLTPASPADKRTLLRRATYDLTGLPPTPQDLQAFMADNSPDAFAKVVDRLLKSPHYGERWGRYWLDIARYSDAKGDVNANREDHRYPYAWTYRDYVIDAFNKDLPYDQFIIQQLAADKLPLDSDKSPLAALGFLTVGKRFGNNMNEIIDDRIDAVSKGFLGLTVSCARCHDHKFDPIPTADYYSLHGVFASTVEPPEVPYLRPPAPTPQFQDFAKQLAVLEAEAKGFREQLETGFLNAARSRAAEYLLAHYEVNHPTNSGIQRNIYVATTKKLDNNIYGRWDGFLRGKRGRHDPIFTPWMEFAKLSDREFAAKARPLAIAFAANNDKAKPLNPLVARMFLGPPPVSVAEVASRYDRVFKETDRQWQSMLELAAKTRRPVPATFPEPNWEALRQVLYGNNAPPNPTSAQIYNFIGQQNQRKITQLESKVVALKMTHPGSPPRPMMVVDSPNPRDSRIFIRGNASSPGEVAPRQFLEALSDNRQPFRVGSGRLELARAIASKDNPLTARVLVNRIWMHHFGEGIVRTPHDFGTQSEAPSHPELLDYLATYLVENGWSIKKLHRLIMLASVYQQSSDENPRFAQIDPSNQLLWRQNVRRLDFEALRDTLLAIGGKIDLTVGGQPVDLMAEPYPTRRTIYGMVDRRNLAAVFRTFDFADPDLTTGQRYQTTVPQQALFLMNNPLVVEQARNLVTRSDFTALKGEEARVDLLYKLIYQREATSTEKRLALRYLESQDSIAPELPDQPAWQYGYGEYNGQLKRVDQFRPMSFFVRNTWVPVQQPDRNFGALSLNADGGHPGPNPRMAVIRRWTAPQDGFINVDGTLGHKDQRGDGVVGRIVSSRLGELSRWAAFKNSAATKLTRVPVNRGDTIDFVVECLRDPSYDAFTWAPTIKVIASLGSIGANSKTDWSAKADFSGPQKAEAKPLANWEKYAQVLLLTNELTFFN